MAPGWEVGRSAKCCQVAEHRASYLNQGIRELLMDPEEYGEQ